MVSTGIRGMGGDSSGLPRRRVSPRAGRSHQIPRRRIEKRPQVARRPGAVAHFCVDPRHRQRRGQTQILRKRKQVRVQTFKPQHPVNHRHAVDHVQMFLRQRPMIADTENPPRQTAVAGACGKGTKLRDLLLHRAGFHVGAAMAPVKDRNRAVPGVALGGNDLIRLDLCAKKPVRLGQRGMPVDQQRQAEPIKTPEYPRVEFGQGLTQQLVALGLVGREIIRGQQARQANLQT